MSLLLGWCMSGHHHLCRTHVETLRGVLHCSCPCHESEAAA